MSPEIPDEAHAMSFGQAASLYDAARPSYPAEALSWQYGNTSLAIADIGAGTGLLSRGLIALGHKVTAVEPDEKMLAKLTDVTEGLSAFHLGNAEDLPLAENSVDAVTAGQAYHWFDPDQALPEFLRVLKPGGFFAPIWNIRDETVDWVAELSKIVGSSQGETTAMKATMPGHFAPYFGEPELKIFRHDKPLNPQALIRLVKSRSYYLAADPIRKRDLLTQVGDLLENHPQLAGRTDFHMPYATYAFRLRPR